MTGQVDNLLVSLSGDVAIDRIVDFVIELVGGRDIGVTLFLAQEPEVGGTDERLDAVATRLRNTGITVKTVITEEPPFKTLMAEVPSHDAIVMGEAAPSLRSLVFGDEVGRVVSASVGPALVVRYDDTLDKNTA